MTITDLLSAFSGGVVGLVLGLLGGGGSIIAVPLLLYVVGVPSAHMAIGTSAVAVSLSALSSLFTQARQGLVKWPCGVVFTGFGLLGTVLGANLALRLPGEKLIPLFGLLMVIVGILMLLKKDAEGDPDVRLTRHTARHMLPWLATSGLAVGALAGFFGIGGGFLIVPALLFATGMPMRNAAATSLAAIAAFGAATAITYSLAGEVNWRMVAFFIAGGIAGAVAGNRMGVSAKILQPLFGALVIATGIYVSLRSLGMLA
ncbi:sulfite exporter TauE/SafE family protein [Aestuariivirga sp.]|uniref:sulfite exporter TauE/SafE family protein n=1 Tax=Aestuariivirga sp. TaxID=2650926 RepID=UPI0039E3BDB4